MANQIQLRSEVRVPVSLIETSELLTSEKLVWVAMALEAGMNGKQRLSQTRLAKHTGYCRQTVATAIGRLGALGWHGDAGVRLPKLAGRSITVESELLLDTSIPHGARLLHMQLQVKQGSRGTLRIKYASLGQELGRGAKSVRQGVKKLLETKWVALEQANRLAPVCCTVRNPIKEPAEQIIRETRQGLARGGFKGQVLMGGVLSLLVASEDYADDIWPHFLVNPQTGAKLQLDRYFMGHRTGFEFNGPQHDHATELYDQATVDQQRARDAIKRDICQESGVELVVIRPEDLSIGRILETLKGLRKPLPLRNLLHLEPAIKYLDAACASYRRACARAAASVAGST